MIAAFQGDPAAASVEEVIFSYPSIAAITIHRIAHELYREGVPMLPRIMAEHAHALTGIDIHPGAEIGESFFIDHGTGVVIGETCVIGNNVKIFQGVTLGALSLARGGPTAPAGQAPPDARGRRHDLRRRHDPRRRHGDRRGSVIGGNAWLVESVPPGSRVSYDAPVATESPKNEGGLCPPSPRGKAAWSLFPGSLSLGRALRTRRVKQRRGTLSPFSTRQSRVEPLPRLAVARPRASHAESRTRARTT